MTASPFIADRGDDRMRLDRVVRRRVGFVAGLSRTHIQALVEAGAVCVNGRVVRRPASRVLAGDRIEVNLTDGTASVQGGVRTVLQPGAN